MGDPRRLIVLRHGETSHNLGGIWQGHLDVPLTPRGIDQARAAAAALAAYGPVELVSSDLKRAAVTAVQVGMACDLPVAYDPRWREFDVGEWTGMSTPDVIALHPQEREAALRGEDQPRGITGEAPRDVAARIRPALADLLGSLPPSACVIVVSHGGTARVVASELLGLSSTEATRLLATPGNCQWAEYVEVAGGWRLAGWNVRAPDLGAAAGPG